MEDGQGADSRDRVVSTERVRSNLAYGIAVLASGAIAVWLLLFPLFSESAWLIAVRWIGIPIVAVFMGMAAIQILNYFNRSLVADDGGISYTNCLGQTRHYLWDEIVAYDIREKSHSIELVLAGHPRTFHETSTNFGQLLDAVCAHTELIAISER